MKNLINKVLLAVVTLTALAALGQQPQTSSPNPQALQGTNSKWANGVGPGYWPYQSTGGTLGTCTGLNLCIGPGTAPQCMGSSHVTYAGTSSFALTNNATNYVYLDLDNSCIPAVNTVGYSNRNIAIAKVVTSGGVVTSLSDDRFWGGSQVVLGQVNAQTGTSYTIASTDRNKLVTISNGASVAITLPTTLGATFTVVTQNIGAGTATLTPSSGTVNGAANLVLTTGAGAWLFFDGTNWQAMLGSSSNGCALSQGVNTQTINYTLVLGDAGKLVTMNGTSITATLPSSPPNSTWCVTIENLNSTSLTVSRNGLTINTGTADIVLPQYQFTTVWTDGSNYFATVPLIASTNVTITPTSNGLNIASTATGTSTATPYVVPVLASPSFTYAGLAGWWSADCIRLTDASTCGTLSNGAVVTFWYDRSGNWSNLSDNGVSASASCTYATSQINGQPAVLMANCTFDTTLLGPMGAVTAFAVFQNTGAKGGLVGGAAGRAFYYFTNNNKEQGVDNIGQTAVATGTAAADTNWHQANVTCESNAYPNFRLDRSTDATITGGTHCSIDESVLRWTVGWSATGGEHLTGYLAELLLYRRVLSSTEITGVETYLNSKYGL